MKTEIDITKSCEWLGEFWCIENEKLKYPGILSYAPKGEIKLTLLWDFEKTQDFFNNSKKYFNFIGNVSELGKVSLMGCIRRGSYCDFGKYNKVEFLIQYFVNGAHLDNSKQQINGFHFSFPGFNKFCSPVEGMQLHNKDKIIEHKWNGLTFTIKNLHNVAYELKNLLLPYKNKKLVDKILKDIDDSSLMISEYTPFLIINFDKSKNFTETIRFKYLVEKLFSIFLVQPIEADKHYMTVQIASQSETVQIMHTLPDNVNKEKVSDYFFLPVNLSMVKDIFPAIWKFWEEMLQDEFNIINIVLTDKIFNRVMTGYQSLVAYEAYIQEWQVRYGTDKSLNDRHEHFFAENLSWTNDDLCEKLKQLLPNAKSVSDIAKSIADMRDCITHTDNKRRNDKKYKQHKNILEDEVSISNICEILFVIFIRAIYNKMGIAESEYQKHNLVNQLRRWEKIE